MEPLGPQDASFLYLETARAPQHVGGVAVLDPSTAPGGWVSREALLEQLASRLHLAPRL
ncbi:MAG TPA: wax ester/triacylglycerol synthase domain-containing protein, partial [Actinomycetota bacterium]|nr:wax ester/triacylglycerol synthase domain-containing protein [Actinomycetota bacterium]